jgi:transcriptional regulator with XRE-family HTH domain
MMAGVTDSADDQPAPAGQPPAGAPQLRTLADKVNWLIDRAHPAGRGPYSLVELCDLIERASGEKVSYTTIWKLRNGQAQNPQKRLIEALARTFGVPPAFFFDDYDPKAAGQLQEQVEMLALVRDSGITAVQLRAIAALPDDARQAVVSLIEATARAETRRRGSDDSEHG